MKPRLTLGSLFSGVGGFDLGFDRAGFDVRWQVEIDSFCQSVLALRWPDAARHRDINAHVYGRSRNRVNHGLMLEPVDVIVGGFPCQDVSVAGQRRGLEGSRSGLFFAFMRVLRIMRARFNKPDWVVIENVPGLLTSQRGRDFHTVLSEVAECGFRRAYRILDSRYFGVAQRRRRVFIVGHRGAGDERAHAVLFESAGSRGDSSASRAARARVAASLRSRSHRAGVNAPGRGGEDNQNLIAFDTTQITHPENQSNPQPGDPSPSLSSAAHAPAVAFTIPSVHRGIGNGHNTNYLPVDGEAFAFDNRQTAAAVPATLRANSHGANPMIVANSGERARTLTSSMHKRHDDDTDTLVVGALTSKDVGGGRRVGADEAAAGHVIAATLKQRGRGATDEVTDKLQIAEPTFLHVRLRDPGLGVGAEGDPAFTLSAASPGAVGVRRLTPLECERLQGFPDGWTCLCGEGHRGTQFCSCPDTPRYKALGNAVTVNVAEWIARRLREAAS